MLPRYYPALTVRLYLLGPFLATDELTLLTEKEGEGLTIMERLFSTAGLTRRWSHVDVSHSELVVNLTALLFFA